MKLHWILALSCVISASTAWGHPPYGHEQKHKHLVDADPDIAGAVQNALPLSYRERYNRPRFVGGMFAYLVSPNSLEALSWHENMHRGSYWPPHQPPVCKKYYYPKPWEVLPTGPRPDIKVSDMEVSGTVLEE